MFFLHKRSGGRRRFRRLAAGAAACSAAVLCAVALTAYPAMAESNPTALPYANGDNGACAGLPSYGGYSGGFCVSLGLYTSSNGEQFVTAQADGFCYNTSDSDNQQCSNVNVDATIANGGGYTDWTTIACGHQNGDCQPLFSYLYPFGGLPISAGGCVYNVWVVISGGSGNTFVTLPNSGKNEYLGSNLEDGHFSSVCLDDGILEATS
jgi:hypothetical protein